MGIKINVQDLANVSSEIAVLPDKLAKRTVLEMSQIAYNKMQEGAGRHSKTGALFGSVYNRSLGPLTREVGHDPQRAPHAPFVVFGTRPHVIRPKNKKALRWVSGNGFVFARVVNHPGYIGDDYLTRSADSAVQQFARIVDDALKGL